MTSVYPIIYPEVTLPELVRQNGIFVDGDWIESKDQDSNGDVRLIQLADVGIGEYLDKSNRFMTSAKAKALKCTFLKPGDVLIARMPDPIGRACIFPGDKMPCVTVVDICIFRPDTSLSDPNWLVHRINSSDFRNKIAAWVTGTTRQRISRGNLSNLKFPLPPLDEQRRIAAILDKADAIRRKRQESIHLTEEFLRSVFLDLFGDPVTNPKGWPVISFGDVVGFMTSGSRGWAQHYSKSGARFLRIQNVGKNKLLLDDIAHVIPPENAEAKRTKVEANDILLSITADLGRSAVIPNNFGEAYINQHLALLRVIKGEPFYYSAFIASEGGQRQISALNKGGVKAGLNFNDIRSLQIPSPPDQMQDKWALIYQKHAVNTELLKQANVTKDNLFISLVQRAFKGEL